MIIDEGNLLYCYYFIIEYIDQITFSSFFYRIFKHILIFESKFLVNKFMISIASDTFRTISLNNYFRYEDILVVLKSCNGYVKISSVNVFFLDIFFSENKILFNCFMSTNMCLFNISLLWQSVFVCKWQIIEHWSIDCI